METKIQITDETGILADCLHEKRIAPFQCEIRTMIEEMRKSFAISENWTMNSGIQQLVNSACITIRTLFKNGVPTSYEIAGNMYKNDQLMWSKSTIIE